MSETARQNRWKDRKSGQLLLVAVCAIAFEACAANHPERTWPPELDLTCEHPVILDRIAAAYVSLSDSKGGPYIVNPPYATDVSGARKESLNLTTATDKAGGLNKMIDGLSELPSEGDALTASIGGSVGFGLALPAEPFYLLYEWYKGPVDLAKLRVEFGTFCHTYSQEGGELGCPRRAESDETVKGYVFLPAGKYNELYVEVDDPNLITRSMTAKCSIE
jgi:hypothetical protein